MLPWPSLPPDSDMAARWCEDAEADAVDADDDPREVVARGCSSSARMRLSWMVEVVGFVGGGEGSVEECCYVNVGMRDGFT